MTLPESVTDNGAIDRNFRALTAPLQIVNALNQTTFFAANYGVIADAVQDATTGEWTGTDNTAAWTAVTEAAVDAGGGLILAPNGNILGNMPQDISSNVIFDGGGLNSRCICTQDLSGPMLSFLRVGSSEADYYQSHLYGVGIGPRLMLDGHGRMATDAVGIQFDLCDRITLEGNVRHFAKQGVKLSSSVRESAILAPYISNCGSFDPDDALDCPAFDLYDNRSQDGSNNLMFIGLRVLYSRGNAMRIERNTTNGSGSLRNIFFYGSMLHNPESTVIGTANDYDGYPYSFDWESISGHCLVLRNARQVFFNGRLNAPGRGMSHVWIGNEDNAGTPINDIHFIGASFGGSADSSGYSVAVTRVSDNLAAVNLRLATGSVFRVTAGTGGLSADTDYFAIRLNDNAIQVASTLADALAGTNIVLAAGNGTLTSRDIKIEVDPDSGSLPTVTVAGSQLDATNDSLPGLVSRHATHGVTVFKVDDQTVNANTGLGTGSQTIPTRASAGELRLFGLQNVYTISGTTTITSINASDSTPNRRVTLIFTSTAQMTDGSNLKLAGNFTGAADRTITLVCDGTNWFETARSTN